VSKNKQLIKVFKYDVGLRVVKYRAVLEDNKDDDYLSDVFTL